MELGVWVFRKFYQKKWHFLVHFLTTGLIQGLFKFCAKLLGNVHFAHGLKCKVMELAFTAKTAKCGIFGSPGYLHRSSTSHSQEHLYGVLNEKLILKTR